MDQDKSEDNIWPDLYFGPINLWTVWPTHAMVDIDWQYRDDKDLLLEDDNDN